jgi:hypothetical protein
MVIKFSLIFIFFLYLCLFSQHLKILPEALNLLGIDTAEVTLTRDLVEPDPFRLEIVQSLMEHPFEAHIRTREILAGLESANTCDGRVKSASKWLGWQAGKKKPEIKKLNKPKHIIKAINKINKQIKKAFSKLSKEELAFLKKNGPEEMKMEQEMLGANIFEMEISKQKGIRITKKMLEVAQKIDYAALWKAGAAAAAFSNELALKCSRNEIKWKKANKGPDRLVQGKIRYYKETSAGPVIVGDTCDNVYKGKFALIIDLGGNDVYHKGAGSNVGTDMFFSLCIDLSGNDWYYADKDNMGIGSAIMGLGMLFDFIGNDQYISRDFSLGSGIFGIGILEDSNGDDTYTCRCAGQGIGFFGGGFLRDLKGNDNYRACLWSQGAACTWGFGLLEDDEGNDIYTIQQRYTDILRYEDHSLSLSQGFASGLRPYASGGIGILWDKAGNDVYTSDIFGQGVSYWFSLGALIDDGGHDRYISYQYAQGAGIHLAVGLLLDKGGNDSYVSKGVSQGCGHDMAFGLLLDEAGSDQYSISDLCIGAGNANGIGLFYDASGVDTYGVKNSITTLGYGDYRPERGYGSLGIFCDAEGEDFYTGRGKNSGVWFGSKGYGVGVDK